MTKIAFISLPWLGRWDSYLDRAVIKDIVELVGSFPAYSGYEDEIMEAVTEAISGDIAEIIPEIIYLYQDCLYSHFGNEAFLYQFVGWMSYDSISVYRND